MVKFKLEHQAFQLLNYNQFIQNSLNLETLSNVFILYTLHFLWVLVILSRGFTIVSDHLYPLSPKLSVSLYPSIWLYPILSVSVSISQTNCIFMYPVAWSFDLIRSNYQELLIPEKKIIWRMLLAFIFFLSLFFKQWTMYLHTEYI